MRTKIEQPKLLIVEGIDEKEFFAAAMRDHLAIMDVQVRCLEESNIIPRNLHKARAQAWLASREVPGMRVGEAAQAGYWPWNSDAFAELWSFVRAL